MQDARDIQTKINSGVYRRTAADNVIDRGRGQITSRTPSAPKRSFSSDYSAAQRARKF